MIRQECASTESDPIAQSKSTLLNRGKYRKAAHLVSRLKSLWEAPAAPCAVPHVASGKDGDADPDFGGSCSKMDLVYKAELEQARTGSPR
jgi:hypothetical protein